MPTPKKSPAPVTPKKGDKADKRCAFVISRPHKKHDLDKDPGMNWCTGCKQYICETCDSPFGVMGHGHDVNRHNPDSTEE